MGSSKPPQDHADRKDRKRKRDKEVIAEQLPGDEGEVGPATSKLKDDKQIRKKIKLAKKFEKEAKKAEKKKAKGAKEAMDNTATNVVEEPATDLVFGEGKVKRATKESSEEAKRILKEKRKLEKTARKEAKKEAKKNGTTVPTVTVSAAQAVKAEKKDRKGKRSGQIPKRGKKGLDKEMATASLVNGDAELGAKKVVNGGEDTNGQELEGAWKEQRFIVFIGNLPYTATTESIATHFASVHPDSIRHSTHIDEPTKSRGFAFLEFDNYDRMETVLKLFHHSMFDDGISPGRKINVELTAGGGGSKSKERKTKIQGKNEKLNKERKRRSEEEAKAKAEKRLDGTGGMGNIHPSRMGRVPGS